LHKSCVAIVAATLVAACSLPAPRQPAGVPAGTPAEPARGARIFRIDTAQSELRVLAFKSGAMAQLGHDHVIENRALSGWIAVADKPSACGFSLQIRAADFIVDDAQARLQEGAGFADEVSEAAKAGTRGNMLSPDVLDAARYPVIAVRSLTITAQHPGEDTWPPQGTAPGATQAELTATMSVVVAGHASTLIAPFVFEDRSGRLRATGMFALSQSAIGLTPFSVMFGALRVADELQVKLDIVAVATP